MNAFTTGFLAGFFALLLLLLVLRMSVPYSSKLFAPTPIPYPSKQESTDWLNFIIHRILTHFQSGHVLAQISDLVSSKMRPHSFCLRSLGNPPTIASVSTLDTGRPDDIRILIPLDWNGGPSVDVAIGRSQRIRVEVDVVRVRGRVLLAWPGGTERSLHIRVDHDLTLDVEIGVQLGPALRLSVTRLPLIGSVLVGAIVFVVSRQVFVIDLPAPGLDGSDGD